MSVLMGNPPVMTVGVPTYNRAWCLSRFLDAVEKLDYPKQKIRIVFVDNFSTDETPRILSEFKSRLERDYESVVIVSERSNIPEARNICVKNSEGEYLLFLDSDVIPPTHTVKRLLEVFASNPRARIVGFPYRCEPPTLAENMQFSKLPQTPHVVQVIGMGCTLIKRSLFNEIGFFNPRYEADEDADLTVRASKSGFIAILDPTVIPPHLSKERFYETRLEVLAYLKYFFSTLAHYHFMILWNYRPRWMLVKIVFYLGMVLSIPLAVIGLILFNWLLVLPFIPAAATAFAFHFTKAKGKWRIVNSILYPLFGMAFSLGIVRETFEYYFWKSREKNHET